MRIVARIDDGMIGRVGRSQANQAATAGSRSHHADHGRLCRQQRVEEGLAKTLRDRFAKQTLRRWPMDRC